MRLEAVEDALQAKLASVVVGAAGGELLVNTPTIVATVDAALASVIVVLTMRVAEAPTQAVLAGGVVAFLAVWAALLSLQRHTLHPLRDTTPRFPTPPHVPT